ncbi:cupin domain-containing protein [Paenibacillus sp.]|uniref:cupin domain-containing protein n=1 Tax=Paenibacillus sp. TaxID=58172 RepID=UPI002D281D13|nr:cupin domain-containing protein [Paenibacillus sp.]HZG57442.1 cupin domain-containing protein [Paenibacillus sp.]
MQANLVRTGDGKTIDLGPTRMTVKEDGSFTRDGLSILEVVVSPNTQLPPPHIHRSCEELFYILEGYIEFIVEGAPTTAGPGDLVTVPVGVAHTYRNATDRASRMLILHTDPRMVRFFEGTESMIRSGVPAPKAIATLLPQYDTEIVT